jgi:putative transposase
LKSASWRRSTKFSASRDRRGRIERTAKPTASASNLRTIRARAITPDHATDSRRLVNPSIRDPRTQSRVPDPIIADHNDVAPDTLTLHSDRGSPMRAKNTAELLVDLGVAASFSRPRVSNDNPFSGAQFKTLKYRPEFPERFESLEQARIHLRRFFAWYNHEHRHSGIGIMTPAMVHFGRSSAIDDQRRRALQAAYAAHPERFKGRPPTPPVLPDVVGINLPQPEPTETPHDLTTIPTLHTNF